MTDPEEPTPEPLEVLSDSEPPPTTEGWRWVPTGVGAFGELTDWRCVPEEAANDWDARLWRPLR